MRQALYEVLYILPILYTAHVDEPRKSKRQVIQQLILV